MLTIVTPVAYTLICTIAIVCVTMDGMVMTALCHLLPGVRTIRELVTRLVVAIAMVLMPMIAMDVELTHISTTGDTVFVTVTTTVLTVLILMYMMSMTDLVTTPAMAAVTDLISGTVIHASPTLTWMDMDAANAWMATSATTVTRIRS